jgi:hypothetical protein
LITTPTPPHLRCTARARPCARSSKARWRTWRLSTSSWPAGATSSRHRRTGSHVSCSIGWFANVWMELHSGAPREQLPPTGLDREGSHEGDAQGSPSTVVSKKHDGSSGGGLAGLLGSLASLKSIRALFTRARVPAGLRRSPSVCRPAGMDLPREEDALAAHYNRRREADERGPEQRQAGNGTAQHFAAFVSTSRSPSSAMCAEKTSHSPHDTGDSILQQDQRQHRLAARRQATAHSGHSASHIRAAAVSQTPVADAFGAAPAPAPAVQSHAVFAPTASSGSGTPSPSPQPQPVGPVVASKPTNNHGAEPRQASSGPQEVSGGSAAQVPAKQKRPTAAGDTRAEAAAPSTVTTGPSSEPAPSPPSSSASPVPSGWVEACQHHSTAIRSYS